ncbi:molybdate transport system ATP-binding protein [Neolewinella xylanilytica]|uniref:Molybdate transport system ATP-binding protein n=1 Tax=Neolewinella xylanilytica TaxID=1514080 RepID=A0A2S6I4J2_9BACT|nr:ATP-binding cassette domain-containing protein [Neolewinella xylanilytica]PPK86103.1 molybdate transport system ATP-binding protein [Neolewinella xylanilytica]
MDLIDLRAGEVFRSKLQPLDLCIREGDHWVITGPRGSGKSLLAEALVGRRRLTAGRIDYPFLGGSGNYSERRQALQLVTFLDDSRLARSPNHVHYYQQRYNAFDASGHPTVRQYLEAGGYEVDLHAEVIDAFGIGDLLDLEKIKLSSGQTRKVLLAREMLRRPRVLVIDNPYVGLDAQSRQILNDLLDRLTDRLPLTLVLCGQAGDLPRCVSRELHLSEDGSWWQGRVGAFAYSAPPVRTDEETIDALAAVWNDRPMRAVGQEIIRLDGVRIAYGNRVVLDGLDWRVKSGEKWVVSGPNGSGKSTLLSLLYADHPQAYANGIYLFGVRRGRGDSIWEIKRRIGFTSPELSTYFREPISAREVVLTGYADTFIVPRQPTGDQLAHVNTLLRYFDLQDEADRPYLQLSSGTQRLLLLCRALVKAPVLLLLDEPFQGLDAASIYRARHLLQQVLRPDDTVVFISHFRPEVPEGMDWNYLDLGRNPSGDQT